LELLSRAPAAQSETTGSRALENIDSKKTGRVAREPAVFFGHSTQAVNTFLRYRPTGKIDPRKQRHYNRGLFFVLLKMSLSREDRFWQTSVR
jgi:hypothetical protein